MPYCTLVELTERYGQSLLVSLTDRADPPANAVDASVVDRAIEDADNLIDGYLAARYQLPLSSVPGLVNTASLAIAIYNLHTFQASEKIEADYKDTLRRLKEISTGIVTLEVAGVEPQSSGSSGVKITDRERPLTAANLKGFI